MNFYTWCSNYEWKSYWKSIQKDTLDLSIDDIEFLIDKKSPADKYFRIQKLASAVEQHKFFFTEKFLVDLKALKELCIEEKKQFEKQARNKVFNWACLSKPWAIERQKCNMSTSHMEYTSDLMVNKFSDYLTNVCGGNASKSDIKHHGRKFARQHFKSQGKIDLAMDLIEDVFRYKESGEIKQVFRRRRCNKNASLSLVNMQVETANNTDFTPEKGKSLSQKEIFDILTKD